MTSHNCDHMFLTPDSSFWIFFCDNQNTRSSTGLRGGIVSKLPFRILFDFGVKMREM